MPRTVLAFKITYKNPLRYLEGILVREKKLIKKLSRPPSPFFEIHFFFLKSENGVPEIDPFYGTPGGRVIVFARPRCLMNC